METYYICNSGMEMYDLSRAYGLGYILSTLNNSEVIVKNNGIYYIIEDACSSLNLNNTSACVKLADENSSIWSYVLSTLKIKKGNRDQKKKEIENMLIDSQFICGLLKKYSQPSPPQFFSSKGRDNETLYQSMDLGATKGFRETIRRKYDEGNQLYISKEDFVISLIGHLHFTIWKRDPEKLFAILLKPDINGVNVGGAGSLKDIKTRVEKDVKIHTAGTLPTLTYTAIELAKDINQTKKSEKTFTPRFSSLLFGVMVKSARQMKPYGGGIYPLDFLYEIIERSENPDEVFDMWIDVLDRTNSKGGEKLAISLAEFITSPSFESLERYIKIHLRYRIAGKVPSYEENVLKEVLHYV